jgi:hypothetical protein
MRYVEELQAEAAAAIARMQQAALEARMLHARAELMRHMLTTAAKVAHLPREAAVAQVVGEWMQAWHLDADAYPDLKAEMAAFTRAFCDYAAAPDQSDAGVRAAAARMETGFVRIGTSLADQMAWRSECAHGWWAAVAPVPPDLPGAKARPGVPALQPGAPFWAAACAPHCSG